MKICKLVEESYSALEVDETAMFYLDVHVVTGRNEQVPGLMFAVSHKTLPLSVQYSNATNLICVFLSK